MQCPGQGICLFYACPLVVLPASPAWAPFGGPGIPRSPAFSPQGLVPQKRIRQVHSELQGYWKKIKQKACNFVNNLPIFAPLRKGGRVASREVIMKKEGFRWARQDLKSRSVYFKRRNRENRKEKKLEKVFWNFGKDFYLCSPDGNGGKQKR